MLETYGVRDSAIVERLALAHHADPTFGFAPRTGDDHARAQAARAGPTGQRRKDTDLPPRKPCTYFNLQRRLVEPTRSANANDQLMRTNA